MKKMYVLPNLITTANMFSGFYSIILSVDGLYLNSAWYIILAAVFDALDGRVARMAHATSSFGVEYDSLSDLVSFGVAPALLVYLWALQEFGRAGWITAFFFLMCGALRLARFNVTTEKLGKGYFQGLPIPMGAGLLTTFVIFHDSFVFHTGTGRKIFTLILTVFLGLLMVSSIPFPSFKEVNWRSKAGFPILFLGIVALLSVAIRPDLMMFVVLGSFVGASLIWNLTRVLRGKSPQSLLARKV